MRIACLLILVIAISAVAPAQRISAPVPLHSLVSAADPLAQQDLTFDPTFAQLTLRYLQSKDPSILKQLADSPAATHLLEHASNFDYDVPKDSTNPLLEHLMSKGSPDRVAACQSSLAYFNNTLIADPHWINETLGYLPADFRFHGALFLIFGYDIGVAFSHNASLNCAHPHFAAHPDELKFYAVHELHHVGFTSYQPPPRLAEIKTCRNLLKLVEYSTQLEGMAVWAAYTPRDKERALAHDEDYVVLQDEDRMQRDEKLYFDDVRYLQERGDEPADDAAWAVITRMSSGERLWYRVGAHMARGIEQKSGRAALVALIAQGPEKFLAAYEALVTPPAPVPLRPPASQPRPRE
jgi:Putative zinc dependent peptidase (DUF5700)